ncbi:MAG: glycosyltransferase family 9 protein [Fibrobacteres bacterium]|jgi:heptosyltransferase-2|nr:glycosyltransferase family 9 protein [Fibrobacterota bacterium]
MSDCNPVRSNAKVRRVERAVLPWILRWLRPRPGATRPVEPTGPHRILVCKWCCLGDAVVSLYAVREFRRRYPGIIIDVLVSARIAAIYRHAPEIDQVYELPITGRRLAFELMSPRLWGRLLRLLGILRGNGYAQFVDLELYRGTGPILKRLLRIPFSRGFQVEGAFPKYHDFEVPVPRHMPEWQCFYRVLGMDFPASEPDPLYPRAHAPGPRARIGIVYGSSFNWPQKKWPWERFAELILLLAGEGKVCVLFGARGEEPEAARILAAANGMAEDTTGLLDYESLLTAVSACDLVVGNDTGTLHVAAACGVPTVTLFGPTDPRKWNPIGSTPVFLANLPCRPCYYLGSMPPCSHFSCLRQMDTAVVAEAVRGKLAGRKPVRASVPAVEDPRARSA